MFAKTIFSITTLLVFIVTHGSNPVSCFGKKNEGKCIRNINSRTDNHHCYMYARCLNLSQKNVWFFSTDIQQHGIALLIVMLMCRDI